MQIAGLVARLILVLATGWLIGLGVEGEIIDMIRNDADLIAGLTALVWAVWYWAARKFGWAR